jgi:hypothetical protein
VRRTVTSAYSAATKKPFSKHERRDGDQLEKEGHAPPTGARVLGRRSFSKETSAEYRSRIRRHLLGRTALEHEPLQV